MDGDGEDTGGSESTTRIPGSRASGRTRAHRSLLLRSKDSLSSAAYAKTQLMSEDLRLIHCQGAALDPYLDALGQLRITVFREFPYLYDGSLEYERDYLRTYAAAEQSLVVLVLRGSDVVGATTCIPMTAEGPEFQEAFVRAGYDLSQICYFGESILLPELRGRGLGKEFFRRREAHARDLGAQITTFCAVDRPEDHPQRPADYRPLNGLWQQQGYERHPELQCILNWKENHESEESPKTLTFWLKKRQDS